MTTITTDPHPDTTAQPTLESASLAPTHPGRPHHSRRHTGFIVAAAGTVAVAALTAGWALTSSSTHTRSAPAESSAGSCSVGAGGVDPVRATVNACLAFTGVSVPDARTLPYS